jgi:hypothetical protein
LDDKPSNQAQEESASEVADTQEEN